MTRTTGPDVVVVGSGPNGLAAAVTLARAGLSVEVLEAQPTPGGGARTAPLGLRGVVQRRADASTDVIASLPHDLCSAVHPLGLASPFLREFDLGARGVDLAVPEISYAQPLVEGPHGRAAIAYRDLDRTVDGLGADGAAWRRTLAPLVAHADAVVELTLGDRRRLLLAGHRPGEWTPRASVTDLRGPDLWRAFRAAAALGAGVLNRPTDGPAGALFAGVAVHSMSPIRGPVAGATGLLLATLGHSVGWPVPVGGSQAIADALLADLEAHGGQVLTGRRVTRRADLPPARDYLFDTAVPAVLASLGDELPVHVRAQLRRFTHGPGASAVTLVLDGPIPWADPDVARSGTVHVAGTAGEIARAQADIRAGRDPERPMVLLGDPVVVDPSRERDGLRAVWTYAHVPSGSTTDMTERVLAQIERFAPGVRDRVVATRCIPAGRLPEHDEAMVGGDISLGAVTAWQMLARPQVAWDSHYLGEVRGGAGAYLGSSAALPGPGVHGMAGWAAARSLLTRRGLPLPSIAPDAS